MPQADREYPMFASIQSGQGFSIFVDILYSTVNVLKF